MAFRAIAIEARMRGGHRGLESVAAGRVGSLGARRARGRHARSGEAAPASRSRHPGGRASPASGARGGMAGHRNRRTCPRVRRAQARRWPFARSRSRPARRASRSRRDRPNATPCARSCCRPRRVHERGRASATSTATRCAPRASRRCASRSRSRSGGWPSISRRSIAPRDTEAPATNNRPSSATPRSVAVGDGRAAEFDALPAAAPRPAHCWILQSPRYVRRAAPRLPLASAMRHRGAPHPFRR